MMRMVVLLLMSLVVALPSRDTGENKGILSREQALELARMLAREDAFLEGPDVKYAPETIGRFFKKEVYERLKGNPFMGYYFEEGGRYSGAKTRTLWVDVISGISETRPWHKMVRRALERLAETKGYGFDRNSPNRVGIYLIQVHPKKTKTSHPGIVAEIYLQNRGNGSVLYTRQYEGDLRGPEAAAVTICDYIYFLMEQELKGDKG